MKDKILVVDDEEDIREYIIGILKNKNYEVAATGKGHSALRLAAEEDIELILLDLTLPDIDGLEVCAKLKLDKRTKDIPVVFVSGDSSVNSKVEGLSKGGVDYITKPFSVRELLARVNVALRKKDKSRELELDMEGQCIKIKGEIINFTPREADLLEYFIDNPGKVLTRESIINRVWGIDTYIYPKTVDVTVCRIRKKIGPDYAGVLETVAGRGYKLNREYL